MNLVALGLGVFLIGLAVYTVSDPRNRARSWVSPRERERDPTGAAEKQEMRTVIYATAVGVTGLGFVVAGLAL